MHIDLGGKTALVTAGASGIGRAIAEQFIESGARVVICDVDPTALGTFADSHPDAVAQHADVASSEDVERLFTTVANRMGRLDILVNNAGVSGPTKPIEEVTPEEWRRTLDVNTTGAFLCARRAAPMFKAQREGVIINISSAAGRLGMPMRAPYSSSKYAIRGLSDTLAIELGEFGIRVNSILPGIVEGARGDRVIDEQARAHGMTYEQYLPLFLRNISMHVAVSARDVAAMATFLASDHARYVTGQSIGVCGNFESYRTPMA